MRSMRVAIALLLLLASGAAPTALAQLPTGCGPIQIPSAPAAPTPVASGGQATVVVDVQNAGSVATTITVTGSTTTEGWSVATSPAPASVPAGQSGSFTFLIEAGESATGDATISFSASGTCDTPLGATCPAAACNAGSQNTQLVVPFQPPQGIGIPLLDNLDIPIEYLLAAIVLVGVATAIPFAMRRKKLGIVAECPEPLKLVKPGRGTSFPIELRNGAKEPASAQFEVGPVPEGWSAFMPLPEVQLAGREARSLWLMVRSPAGAAEGEAVDVELRLRDPRARDGGGVVRVRAEVQGAAEA